MNVWVIIIILLIVIGFVFTLYWVKQRYKPKFLKLERDKVIYYIPSSKEKIIVTPTSMVELRILTLQDKILDFIIITTKEEWVIHNDSISRTEFYDFAVNNNITLKKEECYHGGGIEVLHKSNSDKK